MTTFAQKLRANDPDRKDEKHFLACKYLASKAREIAEYYCPVRGSGWKPGKYYRIHGFEKGACDASYQLEKPLGRMGFIDVEIKGYYRAEGLGIHPLGGSLTEIDYVEGYILVEVKTGVPKLSEWLKQMQFYREQRRKATKDFDAWVLATVHPLAQADADLFLAQGFKVAHLGPKFERWCAEQVSAPAVAREI